MTICSKPEQDQTGQNPSMDWGLVPETPPLAEELTATGERESTFFGVRSFVGCPYSQCMAPHPYTCEQYYGNLEGGGEERRRKINMKLGRGHEVGGGILRDLEMGSGHGSGQNAKSSKDKLKIF